MIIINKSIIDNDNHYHSVLAVNKKTSKRIRVQINIQIVDIVGPRRILIGIYPQEKKHLKETLELISKNSSYNIYQRVHSKVFEEQSKLKKELGSKVQREFSVGILCRFRVKT